MNPIASLFDLITETVISFLFLYNYCIFLYIILSWLFAMDFLHRHKPIINGKRFKWGDLSNFLARFIEPLLRKIRKKIPLIGGQLDLSPIILVIAVIFIANVIKHFGDILVNLATI